MATYLLKRLEASLIKIEVLQRFLNTSLLIILIFVGAISCKSKEKTTRIEVQTKEFTIRDTIIPGFDLTLKPIVIEKLIHTKDTIRLTSQDGNAQLQLWVNKYNELKANCSQEPIIITKYRTKEVESKNVEGEKVVTRYRYPKFFWILVIICGFSVA